MGKSRSVQTHFWNDTFVGELNSDEKLLFLYLITNPLTNMLGVYEIQLRRIAFDTRLNKETVKKGLERLERSGKATYEDGYIILPNFVKNQNYNTNMLKSAVSDMEELPDSVLHSPLFGRIYEWFETLDKGSEMLSKIELELECEIESELELEEEAEEAQEVEGANSEPGYEEDYSIDSDYRWDEQQPIDYDSFVDSFNEVTEGQCRMTPNKKPDIKKQLRVFTGLEIKKALYNRSLALADSEYLTSWESIFTRKPERMEKYLNLKTENIESNGSSNHRKTKGDRRIEQLREIEESWPE